MNNYFFDRSTIAVPKDTMRVLLEKMADLETRVEHFEKEADKREDEEDANRYMKEVLSISSRVWKDDDKPKDEGEGN